MNERLSTPPLETIQGVSTSLFKQVQRMKLSEPDKRLIMRTLDTIRAAARILASEGLPKRQKAPKIDRPPLRPLTPAPVPDVTGAADTSDLGI